MESGGPAGGNAATAPLKAQTPSRAPFPIPNTENRMDQDTASHIVEVGQADFEQKVIAESQRRPVLVDFWADWCGPCHMLMPVLAQLAAAYGGRFLLAKVDSDREQELALQFGIRSLPTVKLFVGGEVVGELMGAQPEGTIRSLLDRFVARDSDALLRRAEELNAAGEVQGAIDVLRQALTVDPENQRLHPMLAALQIDSGELDGAEATLKELPASAQADEHVAALFTRLGFARTLADAPATAVLEGRLAQDPDDAEARYLLSTRQVMAGSYDAALENLLELVRRDRAYGDDAGRRALLEVFSMLGPRDPRVKRYRTLLATALN
jgi:putative thioredoxin